MRSRHQVRLGICVGLLCVAGVTPLPAAEKPVSAATSDPDAIRVLLAAGLETTLSSQMNGTLGELHATFGQRVARNAMLGQLDCSEARARAKVAEAELAMAKQNLEAKRSLRTLNAAGDLEVTLASTEAEKAAGARTLALTQSGYCEIRAPFNARVAKIYVKPFQTVSAGMPLFDLVSDGSLKVRLNVPSVLLRNLKAGMPFEVSIHETGKTYTARISAINSRVDAVAQTVELEAQLDGAHPELIAGMSGTARFAAAGD